MARPGLLALQRDARADAGDAGGTRRPRGRSPGRRDADLHLHLYDGLLPEGGSQGRNPRVRVRSAQSHRRRGRGRADAGAGLRVVRRPVPHPHAPRYDHRGARPAVQRSVRPGGAARRRTDDGVDAVDLLGGHRPGLGDALTERPHRGHDGRLSWRRVLRGGDDVGGARHDPPLRADRRPLDQRVGPGQGAERLPPARRALPPDGLRADLPQVRQGDLRRGADPRHRPPDLRAGPGRDGDPPRDAGRRPGEVRLAAAPLRVRAREAADRHPGRHGALPRGPGARDRSADDGRVVASGGQALRDAAQRGTASTNSGSWRAPASSAPAWSPAPGGW